MAQGGAAFNPLTSFTYRPVGVNVEITPRVTFEGDVILELLIENSALGEGLNVAGQNLPSFTSRKVVTKLRLRDGESNLLAGLLQEEERRSLRGFPGHPAPADHPAAVLGQRQHHRPDRHRDAADAAHRADARADRARSDARSSSARSRTSRCRARRRRSARIRPTRPPAPAPGSGAAPRRRPRVAPAHRHRRRRLRRRPRPAAASRLPPAARPRQARRRGQVLISPPSGDFRVGGGPYTLPVSVTGASRLSSMSLTVTYNPAVLRVRSVQEGSFMRSGGVQAAFTTSQADAGRIDIAVVRPGDSTGVAGTGLLAAHPVRRRGAGPGEPDGDRHGHRRRAARRCRCSSRR